jgi:hypothetical protein
MSQIQIERELFQRFLEKLLELEVDNRAFRALAGRAATQNPVAALRYDALLDPAIAEQRAQFEGIRRILEQQWASEDDAAFLATLSSLLPNH